MNIALKLAPQRSTQYTNMVEVLARPELLSSPLAISIREVRSVRMGGQEYLLVSIVPEDIASMLAILGRLGSCSEIYEYFEQIGEVRGPLLRPLEGQFEPFVPLEMVEARRYRGKTNELFTQVLLNVALFAGEYAQQPTERLRILDPLAGGGTTLFLALVRGYDAFGIELSGQDVETPATFVRKFLDLERIPYKEIDEKGRKAGRRFQFQIGPKERRRTLILVHADTREAYEHLRDVVGGPRMHAIVGDLPYGIQHFGEVASLLNEALPSWEQLLLPGGTIALAWNATRIDRQAMVELVEQRTALKVRNEAPFTQFMHTVDRVIKKRDLLVAVREV